MTIVHRVVLCTCLLSIAPTLCGQTVMLPTVGVFGINTSVAVPDQGETYLGGNLRSQRGQVSRLGGSPGFSYGGAQAAGGASVQVTIIDLDALDRAILQSLSDRSGTVGRDPNSAKDSSSETSIADSGISANRALAEVQYALRRTTVPARRPEYAYLAVISHPEDSSVARDLAGDVRFYLDQAQHARSMRSWASVQVMYEQLWNRLSPDMKREVLLALAESSQLKQDSKSSQTSTSSRRP